MFDIVSVSAQILRKTFATATTIEVKAGGFSMFPTIREGSVLIVQQTKSSDISKGDIVLREEAGRVIAHRVVSTKKGIVSRGDNCRNPDVVTSPENIIGKITAVKRNKKEKSTNKFSFRIICFFILYIPFITRLIFRVMHFFINRGKQLIEVHCHIKQLTVSCRFQFCLNIFLSVLSGLIPLAILYLFKLLIDALHTQDRTQIIVLFSIVIALFGIQLLLQPFNAFIKEKLSQGIQHYSHKLLQQQCNTIAFSYFENTQNQDELYRATVEAAGRPVRMVQACISFLQTFVAGIVIVGILAWQNIYLFIVLCLLLFPWFIFKIRNARVLYRFYKVYNVKEREYYYFHRVLTSALFLKEIKIFNSFRFFSDKYTNAYFGFYSRKNAILKKHLLIEIALLISLIVVLVVVFYLLVSRFLQGTISVGTIVLILLLFQRGFSVIKSFFQAITTIVDNRSYLFDFILFLKKKTEKYESNAILSLQNCISLQNVSFTYPSSLRNAITNVSFDIPKQKTIALVGENGSGKTTLVKLLCGLYNPCEGKILFDNMEVSPQNLPIIRNSVTTVFQDYALYNMPVFENISFDKKADAERVFAAGKQSGIDETVSCLPDSYKTMLGNYFVKGEQLSIGEWQKIAISRAFYRNKDILIFDEPTSALDVKSERLLIGTFKELAKHKTCIIVSHRLSTIDWVDEIVVMHRGQVVEKGSHAGLLALKGHYYEMYKQSKPVSSFFLKDS